MDLRKKLSINKDNNRKIKKITKPTKIVGTNSKTEKIEKQNILTEFSKKPIVIILQLIGTLIAIIIGVTTLYKTFTSGPQILISTPAENSTTLELFNNDRFKTLISLSVSIVNDGDKPMYPIKFKVEYTDDYNTFNCYLGEYDTSLYKYGYLSTMKFDFGDYESHNLKKITIIPPQSRIDGFLFAFAPEVFDNIQNSKNNKCKITIVDIKGKEYSNDIFIGPYTQQPQKLSYPQFNMNIKPSK